MFSYTTYSIITFGLAVQQAAAQVSQHLPRFHFSSYSLTSFSRAGSMPPHTPLLRTVKISAINNSREDTTGMIFPQEISIVMVAQHFRASNARTLSGREAHCTRETSRVNVSKGLSGLILRVIRRYPVGLTRDSLLHKCRFQYPTTRISISSMACKTVPHANTPNPVLLLVAQRS